MSTLKQVMTELKKKGNAQTRKTYARHGMPEDTFGVKIADLKLIAKKIKGNQALACELYETGNYDAMYLAGIVADGSQMTKKQLESWAKTATCATLSEYTVPGVASENPHAQALAMKWIRSKTESIASSGWNTYAGIIATTPDEDLDLEEIKSLLDRVAREVHQAPNKVRYTMNGFVIAVGSYVKPLLKKAKQVAKKVGVVPVDMGDTACKVPQALTYIEKIESAGRVGKKRKTIKC
ncbi:DNA alkylation repair protein [Gimesia aquarii]|uniref:DNA alkylation repair enzyme n=1 Tax=Gimesia aquarii TaxID=2527964 RepID=A0A517WXN0_9PLAN|nr:DNA alkylation repair protein [Gimesia aquarii]QDU10004.1 DNA alkylation repair enzyme [Gimesia aquarii]